MKYLLKKCNENQSKFSDALLEFRNTPNVSGRSPNQMSYGRRLRGRLTHLPGANDLDIGNAIAGAQQRKSLMEGTDNGTPLAQLSIGQTVLLQNPLTKAWTSKGKITGIRPNGRSYNILMDNKKQFIRNRAFMRPIKDDPIKDEPDNDAPNDQRMKTSMKKENVKPRRSERIKNLHN